MAMSASDGFSESMSASASETSLARDSGTRKQHRRRGRDARPRSPRQLETVRVIDASVGLSPGDGQIRVHDGSPMDAVPRRGSFPTAFRDSSAIAAVDAGSTNWSPGVAMYGRSPHNESQSELVIPQLLDSDRRMPRTGPPPRVSTRAIGPSWCVARRRYPRRRVTNTSCRSVTRSRTPDPWVERSASGPGLSSAATRSGRTTPSGSGSPSLRTREGCWRAGTSPSRFGAMRWVRDP